MNFDENCTALNCLFETHGGAIEQKSVNEVVSNQIETVRASGKIRKFVETFSPQIPSSWMSSICRIKCISEAYFLVAC